MGKKYVAYVGTYTHGTSKGIQVYDVNLEEGTLTERSEVEVSNASYTAVSRMENTFILSRMRALRYSSVIIMAIWHVSTAWILMA